MSWMDRMLGRGGAPIPAPSAVGDIPHALPLGLRVGGRVHFDRTLYRLIRAVPASMT